MKVKSSHRRGASNPFLDQSHLRLNGSIVPVSQGNDLEHISADKIMSVLGGRLFTVDIMEFGEPVCVVCMTE